MNSGCFFGSLFRKQLIYFTFECEYLVVSWTYIMFSFDPFYLFLSFLDF